MPSMKSEGLSEFVDQLQKLADGSLGLAKRCAFDGARVLADALSEAAEALPLDENPFTPRRDPLRVITEEDRDDLVESLGVSRISQEGLSVSVSVSFDGYIRRTEEKYPNGVPAALIARSIEGGSSVRAARPFVRTAARKAADSVLAAMQRTMDETIKQTTEG